MSLQRYTHSSLRQFLRRSIAFRTLFTGDSSWCACIQAIVTNAQSYRRLSNSLQTLGWSYPTSLWNPLFYPSHELLVLPSSLSVTLCALFYSFRGNSGRHRSTVILHRPLVGKIPSQSLIAWPWFSQSGSKNRLSRGLLTWPFIPQFRPAYFIPSKLSSGLSKKRKASVRVHQKINKFLSGSAKELVSFCPGSFFPMSFCLVTYTSGNRVVIKISPTIPAFPGR